MKKALLKSGNYEWQWTQVHACGCTSLQGVLGGPESEAIAVRSRLSKQKCPSCYLKDMLGRNPIENMPVDQTYPKGFY